MSIKNKDGTIYSLTKPNPLMLEQNTWKDKKIFHGKFGKTVVVSTNGRVEEEESISEDSYAWCLMAERKQVVDDLYGESYSKTSYGEKFLIKITLIEKSDLSMVISADRNLPIGSIIYPKVRDKRWWKIEQVNDNYYYCTISDYYPSSVE